jgi:hypothetical protein
VLGQAGYIDREGSSRESSRRERYRERQEGEQVVSKRIAVVVQAILQREE